MKKQNSIQSIILAVAAVVFGLVLLFPPFTDYGCLSTMACPVLGYGFIGSRFVSGSNTGGIFFSAWLMHFFIVGVIFTLLYFAFRKSE
jgi:hypothetical protein